MNMFNLFRRRGSAPVARDRLQILLAHERAARGQSDLLAILREEILAVIAKHVTVGFPRNLRYNVNFSAARTNSPRPRGCLFPPMRRNSAPYAACM